MDDVADILERAANRVLPVDGKSRWMRRDNASTRASTQFDSCRVCVDGAIRWAVTGSPWRGGPEVIAALNLLEDSLDCPVTIWNDDEARDARHVASVLRKAARLARERES